MIKGVRLSEFGEFTDMQQESLGLYGETERTDQSAGHEVEKTLKVRYRERTN